MSIKHRTKLNNEQLEVLELLYRFRFASNNLFAEYFNKSSRAFVFKRLNILLELGLIGKRFDSSYRIKGKPAAYYLTPNGARALQESKPKEQAQNINVKAIYKDKTVSEDFTLKCQITFKVYLKLKKTYGDSIKPFTKSDLAIYDYFPTPPPDLYISLKGKRSKPRRFFMELYERSKPSFAIDRRLKQLYEYNNDETWQDRGQDFPLVLCVCESPTQVKNLPKQIRRADYKHNMGDDISFYVTTLDQLQDISIDNKAIWQNVDDLDEVVGLEDIQIE